MSVTRERLQRLADERTREEEKRQDILKLAEKDERDLTETEAELTEQARMRVAELDEEIDMLAGDVERENKVRDVSKLIRVRETAPDDDEGGNGNGNGDGDASRRGPYPTFARHARDLLIVRYPTIAAAAADNDSGRAAFLVERAKERLARTIENTISSDNEGLLPPQHMAQILDIINNSRPVVSTARRVDLSRGKLTYPKIAQRPEVLKQGTEKTEAGTAAMKVDLEDMTADTYLGGGNISWQTINWSTPDALQLWFSLAAEAYARQTETVACEALEDAAAGTVSPSLGTAGTETLAQWRAATLNATGTIYTQTGGRAMTNTLYLSADQFFTLAALSTDAVLQMSPVGQLDVGSLTGTFSGLRVVGSYGFAPLTRIIGDGNAFLVGETPGAPVEMRAVEPSIGGMEVGVIGAFAAKVFDDERFLFLS